MKKRAELTGPGPYPAEEPQRLNDRQQEVADRTPVRPDYSDTPAQPPKEYQWFMSGTHISVSDKHGHDQLADLVLHTDYAKPYALGTLQLGQNWKALWSIQESNMASHVLEKRLKRYTSDQGWSYAGTTAGDHSPVEGFQITAEYPGIGEHNPGILDWKNKEWSDTEQWDQNSQVNFYGEQDPTDDEPAPGPRICSECGEPCPDYSTWRLHVERAHINPNREPSHMPSPVVDLDKPLPADFNTLVMDKTVQRQSNRSLFWNDFGEKNFDDFPGHRSSWPFLGWEGNWHGSTEPGGFHIGIPSLRGTGWKNDMNRGGEIRGRIYDPETEPKWAVYWNGSDLDMDAIKQQVRDYYYQEHGREIPEGEFQADPYDEEAGWDTYSANQQIQGPMPFIFDIEKDRIYVGHPGERHSDIQGSFTPGGIVEGLYLPDGKVQIKSDTDMPYSVRHMIELWYYMHPELEVKQIYLMTGDKKYKLASANIAHKVRNLVATDPAAWNAYQALAQIGNVYAVGGIVRDVVLGKIPNDVDLLVQGVEPHVVMQTLKRLPGYVKETGKNFSVLRYYAPDGSETEIALPRTERSTGPGHKDFDVQADAYLPVEEDLARRDFTANAMAVNLNTGELIDPFHGSEDIKAGELKMVNPQAFLDDPLRILRAFSAISKSGLKPTAATAQALREDAPRLEALPKERLRMEMDKLMEGKDPEAAIRAMRDYGVLTWVLPEVAATVGFDQNNKHHRLPLDEHSLEVLRGMQEQTDDPDARMAALLHDIGKPKSYWEDDEGHGHFYYQGDENKPHFGEGAQHEEVGAEMARQMLDNLKYPNDRIKRIEHLVRHHMFPPFRSEEGARKFMRLRGAEHAEDLLKLRRADSSGKGANEFENQVPVDLQEQLVEQIKQRRDPVDRKMLAITGDDLQKPPPDGLGLTPGPQFTPLLDKLVDMCIKDPALNQRETLLRLAWDLVNHRQANILDPIQDELDPNVFDHAGDIAPDVRKEHIKFVREHVYRTMVKYGWPDPAERGYLNMILTGSLTTYQWSHDSDFDVSLWVDASLFPDWVRSDLISLMIQHVDGVIIPGTSHPLQCYVVASDKFKREDLYKKGIRSAYDLDTKTWLVLPERTRSIDVYKAFPAMIAHAKQAEDKMRLVLEYNPAQAVRYYHAIHKKRMLDMIAGKGDYAESNIVYKWLFNHNLIPQIADFAQEHIASTEDNLMGPYFDGFPKIEDAVNRRWAESQSFPYWKWIHNPETGQFAVWEMSHGYPEAIAAAKQMFPYKQFINNGREEQSELHHGDVGALGGKENWYGDEYPWKYGWMANEDVPVLARGKGKMGQQLAAQWLLKNFPEQYGGESEPKKEEGWDAFGANAADDPDPPNAFEKYITDWPTGDYPRCWKWMYHPQTKQFATWNSGQPYPDYVNEVEPTLPPYDPDGDNDQRWINGEDRVRDYGLHHGDIAHHFGIHDWYSSQRPGWQYGMVGVHGYNGLDWGSGQGMDIARRWIEKRFPKLPEGFEANDVW